MEKTGFFVAIALIAAGLTACDQQQEKKQQVLKVTVETVTKSSNASVSTYVGQVEEQAATSLSFTGIGNIKQVLVTEGQHVSKGQLVAVLDEVQARNALASAETSLTQAQDGYDRLKQVYEGGSLAEQKWVEVQSQLQQARNMRDIARKNLQDCRLISPVSGVVGDLTLEAGETALPSAPVCNVLNIDNVKVKVAIPEHEIAAITATTPSTISVEATGGQPLKGGRIEKGVTADALTRTYDIKILLPNPGHKLLPGMVASVQLNTGVNEGGLAQITLPVTAVQQGSNGQNFVWLKKDGKATRKDVSVGQLTGNRIVITSGLLEGDEVIVEGYQKVSEGASVK